MRIAVIGGGIGGLTTALALRQFGFEPQVFEQAPHLLEVGAAILMWPNAMRVLHRLGVADTIREHGGVLEKSRWLRRDGKLLNHFSLPSTDVPAVALHRADLQQALVHALPQESIHLDHVFEAYEQLPDSIVAHFSNGSSFESDVLIGADGLHSRTRAQLLDDGQPDVRGYIAWRGVLPYQPASGNTLRNFAGAAQIRKPAFLTHRLGCALLAPLRHRRPMGERIGRIIARSGSLTCSQSNNRALSSWNFRLRCLRDQDLNRQLNVSCRSYPGALGAIDEIAQHASVIDSPLNRGNVIPFSKIRSVWTDARKLLDGLHAILNFDNLNAAGRWTRSSDTEARPSRAAQ
jgi:hypothetical protein